MVWPEPTSSAAGTRMVQLIQLFQEYDYEIVFVSSAQESDFSYDLNSIGVVTKKVALNCSSFDDYIKELNPDMVLFDRFISEEQFGWRVAENCPTAIRVLDTEDLHCLRITRQNAVKHKKEFQIDDLLDAEISKREIASIYRCDLSLLISDFEMTVLQTVFKIDPSLLYYLPMFYNVDDAFLAYEDRKDFVFIGNFLHEPNYDAVIQLKSFWKQIKTKLPQTKLNVYGAYPIQKVQQLHNEKEGFLIHGRAENALEVIKSARVLLAPLRFGGGIKGKLLEAMVVGTPSVTTPIGSEGISNDSFWNGYIADDWEDFILKAIELYSNTMVWNTSQLSGVDILKHKFSIDMYRVSFFNSIETLSNTLNTHRKFNFIGAILQKESHASTKFMSKWIEAKNKIAT